MMNYLNLFISNYVKQSRRDRLRYEASSIKKKNDFINHFCHDTLKYINEKKIIFHGDINKGYSKLKEYDKESFFVISLEYFDGILMNFEELMIYLTKEYMSILAIANNVAIIKEETEFEADIFVLA